MTDITDPAARAVIEAAVAVAANMGVAMAFRITDTSVRGQIGLAVVQKNWEAAYSLVINAITDVTFDPVIDAVLTEPPIAHAFAIGERPAARFASIFSRATHGFQSVESQ